MKKQILRISLLQTAKVMAGVYLVLSLPLVALWSIFMSVFQGNAFSWLMLVGVVIGQMLCAFLMVLLNGWIYNLVAGRIGGFEFTTAEVATSPQ